MNMSLGDTLYFYLDYFFSKVLFLWVEVYNKPFRIFFCEILYSFGKIFHYYINFSSSLYNVDFYETRFGKFHIRPNTMDIVSASPAFERPDILYMRKLLKRQVKNKKHVTFLDIGADFGSYTVNVSNFFKRLQYNNVHVYSFEPTQSSYELLSRNIVENGPYFTSPKAFHFGLSFENDDAVPILFNAEDPGSTSIKDIKRDSRISSRQQKEVIAVKALDVLVAEGGVDIVPGTLFVKIDVEGYETHVLEGAMKTLKDIRYDDVYVMVEDSIDRSVMDFLVAQGFTFLKKSTPYNSWWHYRAPLLVPAKIDPFLSVVIVNWNGKKWLTRCLDSLRHQTYRNFEIILVDNASHDESVLFVKEQYPEVIIVQSGRNLGFSGGNNLGVEHAHGDFVVLLNNDTWAEPDYLEKFIQAFREIPNLGSAQSKIVLMDDHERLDVCGSYWTNSTFLYHFGYGKDQSLKKYNKKTPFFSNKGASMIIRKDLIRKIGLFDESFWCYYEETDFCHRVWLAGYECWYYPEALIHHAMGGTSVFFENSYIQYHNFKNKLRSFLKNFEWRTLLVVLPTFLILNFGLSVFWMLRGKKGSVMAFLRSLLWNIRSRRETFGERRKIQAMRERSDKDLFLKVRKNPGLHYYYHMMMDLSKYLD